MARDEGPSLGKVFLAALWIDAPQGKPSQPDDIGAYRIVRPSRELPYTPIWRFAAKLVYTLVLERGAQFCMHRCRRAGKVFPVGRQSAEQPRIFSPVMALRLSPCVAGEKTEPRIGLTASTQYRRADFQLIGFPGEREGGENF